MTSKTLFLAIALAAASAADVSDTCTACTTAASTKATGATTIANKDLMATYTCSASVTGLDLVAAGSLSLKCNDGYFYTAASGAVAASCTACTDAGAVAGANAYTWTCKDSKAGSLKVVECDSGYYLAAGAGTAADECKSCTSVTGTAVATIPGSSAGVFTCTAADTGITFATGSAGCDNGYFFTAKPATAGTGAKCEVCTDTAAAAGANAAKWTCKDSKAGLLKVTECKSGFVLVAGAGTAADACTACTSAAGTTANTIANSASGAVFTCSSATNSGIDFTTSSVKCNAGYFHTAASGATGATCSQCMDGATPAVALVAPDGIQSGARWTCDKKTGGRVVIPSTGGCWSGYKSGIAAPAQSGASVASVSVAVLLVVASWGL